MKTKRSHRCNKNRRTMKVGGGNMFRKKIAPKYSDTYKIHEGSFWKEGHGGMMGLGSYGWKKRDYKLFKKSEESHYVLIYFDGTTEQGNIKFNRGNVIDIVDSIETKAIKMSYIAELTETLSGTQEERRIQANNMAERIKVINITDISANNKEFPIFFETEADYTSFINKIKDNTSEEGDTTSEEGDTKSNVLAASGMSPKKGGSKNILKTRRRKHKRKTRRRKNNKRKSRRRSIKRR